MDRARLDEKQAGGFDLIAAGWRLQSYTHLPSPAPNVTLYRNSCTSTALGWTRSRLRALTWSRAWWTSATLWAPQVLSSVLRRASCLWL